MSLKSFSEFIDITKNIYENAGKHLHIMSVINAKLKEIQDSEKYEKMATSYKNCLEEMRQKLAKEFVSRLQYTIILDDKRTPHNGKNPDGTWCYGIEVNGETFWIPIKGEQREKDIQEGRLDREFLHDILNHRQPHYRILMTKEKLSTPKYRIAV